ncbi:MAG TPA: hypothetical protein VNS32_04585, partial [Flavisolibacter sp.]|nr:hypothetical protein [Flavisolibacter sp.]
QAGFPNANSGIHIFRIQPATGLIIDNRKITGAPPPSVNTMLIDKNDQLYIFNGEGYIPSAYTMNLYSSSGLLDSLKIDPPLFSQQNSLLKMGWNDLKWLKRSGGNGFSGQVTAGSPFMINDRPVVAIISTDNNQPVYWDGKLIHNGFPVISTSLVELDSNGVMQRNKVIDGFSLRMSRGIWNKQVYLSGMMTKALRIDTIQVNFAGGGFDGLAFVLDSNYTAKKSYRVASPYMETMLDMDIFKDSLVALAYTAQGDPQLYTNRIQANTRDYQEDAYLGTIVTRMDVVTAINTPPASVSLSVSPNPVRDAILHLRVGVDEVLKSSYAIYQSNGQYISGGYEQLLPGKNDYSIPLPAGISKGVYHILISNKSWIATKTFVVM